MACQGKPVEMQDLRTAEQKQMMQKLLPILLGGMEKGATPFGGQLSAPPDPGMLSAMNMMMQVGGQGPYQYPGMQTGPYGGGGGGLTPGGYSGGGGGAYVPGEHTPPGTGPHDWESWWNKDDPFAPGTREPRTGPPGRRIVPV